MARVRVLRVLEYEGEYEWVQKTLSDGSVPMNGEHRGKDFVIRSAVVGNLPELLKEAEEGS